MAKKRKEATAESAVAKTEEKAYLAGADPFMVDPGSKGALVAHIMQTLDISKTVDRSDPESLLAGLQDYLRLCAQTNTSVTNMGMYQALGVSRETISNWASGKVNKSDSRFREFAILAKSICAQYRELSSAEGKLNPTLAIWWQKNYDSFQDAPAPEKLDTSAFDRLVDPEEIAAKYKHMLTDDSGDRMEKERERRSVDMQPVIEDEEE